MLKYKDIDLIKLLKDNGYSSYKIRKEKIIPEGSMSRIRNRAPIGWETIETLCKLLHFQPSDFLVFVEEEPKIE